MPALALRDRQVRSAYQDLEARRASSPSFQLDASNMLDLLAAVADRFGKSRVRAQQELSRPGITRAEQVELVQRGMSSREKRDLEAILDGGTVPLSAEVKRFLEQVVGRAGVSAGDGSLQIAGDQRGGVITGTAKPGATIEAINLSTTPNQRLRTDDTFELAKADSFGRFSGRMDMKAGDLIRMRTREADGRTGQWLTIRAEGMGPDTRNAEVALFRIGLTAEPGGVVDVKNINASRPISEPGATLRFVNQRTGEKTDVVMNDQGSFPGALKLGGRDGDVFSVRATDGVNNRDLSLEAGTLQVGAPSGGGGSGGVDLDDPALHRDELNADGTPRFKKVRYTGPLFTSGGASATDVKQGQIGDCYLPSAVASIAHAAPGTFERIMRQNDDGTYTVTFKKYDSATRSYKDDEVTVDGDLYVRSWGGPLYGASDGDTGPAKMEMWWPILEKAYAQWKGSFDRIGNGGSSSRVMSEILGRRQSDLTIRETNADAVWNKLKASVDAGKPVSAGTYDSDQSARYTNSGVYADHSYSVLGYETKPDGSRIVKLRNPWGESEPRPGDGRNDGVFTLPLEKFVKLYSTLYTVE